VFHWFCGRNVWRYIFPRLGFSSRKIERAVVELDHVTFVDEPTQIGREREFAWLGIFG